MEGFENGLLRRIFGPNRDEVTGELRKLHNEELYNFYASMKMYSLLNQAPRLEDILEDWRYSSTHS
jgi:hypothetical protein